MERVCIIHTTNSTHSSDDGNLIKPKDLDSWRTLLTAATVRQHQPLLDIAANLGETDVYYHRTCRQIVTMKRELDKLSIDEPPEVQVKRQSFRKISCPNNARTLDKNCILCPPGKHSKFIKGTRTREPLVKCSELQADAKLREAATRRQDTEVLAIVSRELVAAEAWYHKSCYRDYTRCNDADDEGLSTLDTSTDPDTGYSDAEKSAFDYLFQYIRRELFESPNVVRFIDLTTMMTAHMQSMGVEVKESTKKHVRRKTESDFGDSLHIFANEKGKLLIFPDNLSVYDLAKENQRLKKELHVLLNKSCNLQSSIDKTALHIRSSIKAQKETKPWPFLPSSLENNVKFPRI